MDPRQVKLPPTRELNLSESERRYIEHVFSHDPKTAQFLTEMARAVADIEQEVPDPRYERISPTLPTVQPGEDTLFDEEFPEELYGLVQPSPEPAKQVKIPIILFYN